MKILFTITSIIFLDSCLTNEIIANPPVITDYNNCGSACANLIRLQCKEGTPIKSNKSCKNDFECSNTQICDTTSKLCITTCETFCIETEKNGVWLNPNCIIHINKCEDIDDICNRK